MALASDRPTLGKWKWKFPQLAEISDSGRTCATLLLEYFRYDSMSDLGEIRVYQRADFQSGSRVLKKVFWTFSYLYLWHTMWFHAKKLLKTLKFWKSLNSLCKSGSRPQKSPKKAQKTDHSIAIYSNFWIGMVYFGYHLVKAHVQTVQNMYGKGG